MNRKLLMSVIGGAILSLCSATWAGPVFLTGHDPDFHAQLTQGARNLLTSGIAFVTGGTYVPGQTFSGTSDPGAGKFLWVESRITPPPGYLIGENGLGAIGLTLGTDYDRVNGAELAALADFSGYTAIVIASTFGGLLTNAELNALIAKKPEIGNFINAGGGLMALAESFQGGSSGTLLAGITTAQLFSFLPVTVSSIAPVAPFTVTAAGAAGPYKLVNGDVNDPTHNSFGLIGGLTPLDLDNGSPSQATTLAGNVRVGGGGFEPVPEPGTIALLGLALAALRFSRRKLH